MGEIEEPSLSSPNTTRKSKNLTAACELYKLFEFEMSDDLELDLKYAFE